MYILCIDTEVTVEFEASSYEVAEDVGKHSVCLTKDKTIAQPVPITITVQESTPSSATGSH